MTAMRRRRRRRRRRRQAERRGETVYAPGSDPVT